MNGPVLELAGLRVERGGHRVLDEVDLTVRTGEFATLLGANGSGKSTLIKVCLGLIGHSRGTVRVFGAELSDFSEPHRVGYVPQRSTATNGIPTSVREVVVAGRLSRRRLLQRLRAADHEAVDTALEIAGLTDLADRSIDTLSGGQQQRTLIARALAGEPDLLVLDEPTAGVDLPNQLALAATLGRLKASGATIVLVSHELGPMADLVDTTTVLRGGRVVYHGPPLTASQSHDPELGEDLAAHTHHWPESASNDAMSQGPWDTSTGRGAHS